MARPDQGHVPVAQFQTKCCNNLAIDYADQNYFASSALDHPGIMVWDRRAVSRHAVSPSYAAALEHDNLPWGGALRLDRAVQTEVDPALVDSKSSFIRSLRFCRDHRGMLAVLSRTGQLRVFSTRHEYVEADIKVDASPELLEVRRSFEIDPLYAEPGRKNDKIVSFDWITMSSPVPQPRLLVLRASGAFDVLQKPSFTSEYPFKLIPWQPPHRGSDGTTREFPLAAEGADGLAESTDYQEAMEFEPSQAQRLYGPLLTEQALSDVPLLGPEKADAKSVVENVLAAPPTEQRLTVEVTGANLTGTPFDEASSVAEQLQALRLAARQEASQEEPDEGFLTQLERHEKLLSDTKNIAALSSKARYVLDHTMLLRAKEGYRFDFVKNQQIVADDPWLKDVWAWVAGESTQNRSIGVPLTLAHW